MSYPANVSRHAPTKRCQANQPRSMSMQARMRGRCGCQNAQGLMGSARSEWAHSSQHLLPEPCFRLFRHQPFLPQCQHIGRRMRKNLRLRQCQRPPRGISPNPVFFTSTQVSPSLSPRLYSMGSSIIGMAPRANASTVRWVQLRPQPGGLMHTSICANAALYSIGSKPRRPSRIPGRRIQPNWRDSSPPLASAQDGIAQCARRAQAAGDCR